MNDHMELLAQLVGNRDPRPPITWDRRTVVLVRLSDGARTETEVVFASHPGYDCVFVDHQCSCGKLDIGCIYANGDDDG